MVKGIIAFLLNGCLIQRLIGAGLWLGVIVLLVLLPPGAMAAPPTAPILDVHLAEVGQPFIHNFEPEEYGGAPQNWAIAQDRQGVIYVGNNDDGVLAFDGTQWRRIAIPNLSIVRSLAVDAAGRIYVGAVGELGYLAPDASGRMQYVSLLDRIAKEDRGFADVWQVFPTDDGVYFSTFTSLFRLRGNQVTVWKPTTSFHFAFRARDSLFIREVNRGLMQLVDDQLVPVAGGERFATEKIYALLPWGKRAADPSGDLLIGTRTQGWLVFDGAHYRPWMTEADAALKRDGIYGAIWLADGTLAVATLLGGVSLLNDQGRLLHHLTKASGLVNDVVYALFQDRQRGLWLGLGTGVARIDMGLPVTHYADRTGLEGTVLALQRHAGSLYAGTLQGLFRLETDAEGHARFVRITEVPSQSWGFLELGRSLLVANSLGVFEIRDKHIRRIRPSEQISFYLLRSKQDASRVFVGLQDGLASMRLENDRWIDEGMIPGVAGDVSTLFEEPDGRLWLGNRSGGVIRVTFPPGWAGTSDADQPVRVESFGIPHGLPGGNNFVYPISGRPRFTSTAGGVLQFDERRGRFVPDPQFATLFPAEQRVMWPVQEDARGRVWMATADRSSGLKETGAAVRGVNGIYRWVPTPLQPISGSIIEAIHDDRNGVMWFGGTSGLFRYDSGKSVTDDPLFTALVRIVPGPDGRSVPGVTGAHDMPQIAYANNALRFEFAAPSYDTLEATRFQFFLEGLDKVWSAWSSETYRDYTNIQEGDYRFRVRARNVYGVMSAEASYAFSILPPWYRTWWAKLVFATLLIAILWLGFRWRSTALHRHNIELAGLVSKRTEELARANEALLEQTVTDPLTGLRNRRFLQSRIDEDIALVHRLYQEQTRTTDNIDLIFLMVDIDHFKEVNDHYGHASGDRVLEQMRDILLAGCRESDTPVRWGGEEFLIVGRFTNRDHASVFAERIRYMVANHAFVLGDGQTLYRTCSIGFACYPFFTQDVGRLNWEEVISLADQCLYAAKHSGRNAWVGIQSTEKDPEEDFSTRAHCGLAPLVKEGYLRIYTSLTDAAHMLWE